MDGILLIDKPTGWTSHDVVAKIRGILAAELRRKNNELRDSHNSRFITHNSPRTRVGHTGTLDPAASGLLVLVLGKYTKRAGEFSKLDKIYETEVVLGKTSTTGDSEGEITPFVPHHPPAWQSQASDDAPGTLRRPNLRSSVNVSSNTPPSGARSVLASHSSTNGFSVHVPSEEEVKQVLSTFMGEIQQTPPAFSAIKVNGQRAYKLARAGKEVKLEPRKVTIYEISGIKYKYPKLSFTATVSSGTYIRSLAEDIGAKLDTGAYMSALRRTQVGQFDIKDVQSLEGLSFASIQKHLKP
jgi:tRNA pseudouridine55 synthase